MSDNDVKAQNGAGQKYEGKQVATEDMLTTDKLQWSIGCTVGTIFSRDFAQRKAAVKVSTTATTITDNNTSTPGSGSDTSDPGQEG